jgi:hypothetical protein
LKNASKKGAMMEVKCTPRAGVFQKWSEAKKCFIPIPQKMNFVMTPTRSPMIHG